MYERKQVRQLKNGFMKMKERKGKKEEKTKEDVAVLNLVKSNAGLLSVQLVSV